MNQISKGLKLPGGGGNLSNFYLLLQHERIKGLSKVIYPKHSKPYPYILAAARKGL